LTYHTIDLGPQPAGLETSVSIAYVKDSDALTVEHFEIQSSAPISERTSGRVRILDVLPWGLGLLGVLLLVGGLWWYWQTGREKPKARRSKRGQRSRRKQPTFQVKNGAKSDQDSQKTADNAVYCHQCGKRAETGDRFCRSCGTKLRAT
jgi:hypothetical protein